MLNIQLKVLQYILPTSVNHCTLNRMKIAIVLLKLIACIFVSFQVKLEEIFEIFIIMNVWQSFII